MEKYLGKEYSDFFFTSDLHISHKNILKYDNRPFKSIEEHDQELIININNKVSEKSCLFILGDVSMTSDMKYLGKLLSLIKCDMVLIKGNHDSHLKQSFISQYFINDKDYLELRTEKAGKLILSHYPHYSWNGSHRGNIHLHGHMHTLKPTLNGKYFNVGVCNSDTYSPFSLDDILEVTNLQTIGTHHEY
jgi:calcineurin-like phosphoesterase family protein